MKQYVKKPIPITAIQFEEGVNPPPEFGMTDADFFIPHDGGIIICTKEGNMRAADGDYIIRGVVGEFYPCKKDIFEQSYEEVL